MDEAEFRRLVAAHERDSRDEPRAFAQRTAAVAVLGYVAIVGLLGAAAAGLVFGLHALAYGRMRGGLVVLVIACASLLYSLLRAVWVRSEPPQGLLLTRTDAPPLFDLIERVCKRIGAPRPDRVWLDGELNAAVMQQPRLGLLGWHRNHLVLGLPLMLGLSSRQLGAVIAHEFGHLRGAHGKLGAWVYRTRRSWWRLVESRERASIGGNVADLALALFFRYFWPRFNARAFVLARQQEYEADRVAHGIAGTRHATEGLQAIEVQARWLAEEFWPAIYRRAASVPTPAAERPYHTLREALPASLRDPRAAAWLAEAMKRLSNLDDTHPSLRDRLDFAEAKPKLPPPPDEPAAAALLGVRLDDWIGKLDDDWRGRVGRAWAERHRFASGQRHLVAELAAEREQEGLLDPDEHLLWARAVRLLDGDAAAQGVLRRLVDDHPADLAGRYELGMMLVDSADRARADEGAELLRHLAEGQNPWAWSAAQRREAWLEKRERFDELKTWRPLMRKREQEAEQAMEALHDFEREAPHFDPHGLRRRVLRPLQDLMRGEKAAGRVYLMRRSASAAPGWRFFLVVIERSGVLGQPDAETWWAELRERIELPGPFMVIDLAHPYWKDKSREALVAQMKALPNAQVHAAKATRGA